MSAPPPSAPWYREPWPWILMSGPLIVVLAGLATLALAMATSDGLVADDYYKQGLAINRVIERGARAGLLGIGARVEFDPARNAVAVRLASHAPLPGRVRLTLVHPTRPDVDQVATLTSSTTPGLYEGRIDTTGASHWIVALEDEKATWRVGARWNSATPAVTLPATTD